MNTTANLVQEVERLTQALSDSNLALMEQTELADKCLKQAETLEAEWDQARAQLKELRLQYLSDFGQLQDAAPQQHAQAAQQFDFATLLMYPQEWDVAAYPTIESAMWEMISCAKIASAVEHERNAGKRVDAQAALSDDLPPLLDSCGKKKINGQIVVRYYDEPSVREFGKECLATRQPAPVADDDGPEFTVDDPDLDALLNAVADWKTTPQNMDTGLHMMSLLERVEDRLKAAPVAAAVQGDASVTQHMVNVTSSIVSQLEESAERIHALRQKYGLVGCSDGETREVGPINPVVKSVAPGEPLKAAQGELPPLPDPHMRRGEGLPGHWSKKQMRDFYQQGRAAGIEEAANLVAQTHPNWDAIYSAIRALNK